LSRIKILSEHLANQIAAGEVIERPASVVKELLENSIDAGASQVQIEIAGNGTRLIRVVDNGMGMDGDDVLLCLERHATSKLRESTEDGGRLGTISSLGFRGEAIPSIGSVAKMTITSRTGNEPLGTRVEVRYGKVLKIHEMGCNQGTVFEIRDLFGNLPARKKFLKSPRTELFHIEEIIKNYGLANNLLGIAYSANNSRVLDFAANTDSLEERVKILYNLRGTEPLIPLHDPGPQASAGETILVRGYLLPPDQSFAASARLRLFVNGRAVKDRMMAHAVTEGLSGYLMKGRTAAGVVFVTLPPEKVDVNVHPTKQEIRFQEPNRIHEKIVAAVRLGMNIYQQSSRDKLFGSNLKTTQVKLQQPSPSLKKESESGKLFHLWNTPAKRSRGKETLPGMNVPPLASSRQETPFMPETGTRGGAAAEPAAAFSSAAGVDIPVPETLRPIGQFMDLYLLCEARREDEIYLVVIDQHAVHERILFENLKKQFAARQMTSQNLLFPKMLELWPEHATLLAENREHLLQLGLVIEEFGGNAYIIKGVPAILSHLEPEEILTGILQEFSGVEYGREEGSKRADATRIDNILSSMACKAAIKAGQNLEPPEMHELLKLMRESRAFTHCPHGRPVVRMFSATDIKKWFHRT
jgi:DNA mismatch repair protein MutL